MASLVPSMRRRLPEFLARTSSRPLSTSLRSLRQGPGAGENFQQANDPKPRTLTPNVSKTHETPTDAMGNRDAPLQEIAPEAEKMRTLQAPNRAKPWSRNQMPRELAMTGPRFEQTIIEAQPAPLAAIELIHKQPVRWVNDKRVACDGGGGPLGHPRIYINVDKPLAKTEHKKYLESQPHTAYPLAPTGDPMQIEMPASPTQKGEIQGQYPHMRGEQLAQSVGDTAFEQR
ncbi:hypothetical protein LTR99_007273 [Exophiala xenobiotica]|uniref:Zinc finger CHCC-type domain-containing protein n=1 Tax=Vermiconidia calcicola TaxID=1690605 RepID=A0AAV9Q5D5_9PEZI|nr:hypothetical protein LTR41_006889 [Exophiala xenobiotica]KAK5534383.1 hypothetical protein LTR25_006415 [Vermiconidia calcicola]KAK5536171.1 hypothetical protein LTR23_008192 [Chaetothyriales sp. CCFEE 6169]KAK5227973.1 hypothetical protein LTR72_001856 [Exophiala xenobiotica]KAK5260225.1 hypothetical protein LTR40_004557 [Exophiala xenobiotica]